MKLIQWVAVVLVLVDLAIAITSLWLHDAWNALAFGVLAANAAWLGLTDWWRQP